VAILAGAELGLAARIGLAMTLLQLGIGTLNDVVDAPTDAGLKPGKPIPAGLVGPGPARNAAIALFLGGAVLAATAAPVLLALSALVIGIGLSYDLRLKGTAWSWLPFAVGIPILPVFGWLGATGTLPAAFAVLIPAAMAAGAALAITNSLVDVERDRAAGRTSVAATLGATRAAATATALFAAVALAAVVTAWRGGAAGWPIWGDLAAGAVPVVASLMARGASAARREWAWRVEAVATGILAILWLGMLPSP
jgi:4-hydroxybenzoate polyprenyltransferase